MLRGLDQKKPVLYGYGHVEFISRVRKDIQSVSCDMVVGEVSSEVYLPQLACCAGKPSPYVVCQLRWQVESCTIVRVRQQSVVVHLHVEIRIFWVIRGWGWGYLWLQCAAAQWASQQPWVVGAVPLQPVPGVTTWVCIRGAFQAYGAVRWDLFTVVRVPCFLGYVVVGLLGGGVACRSGMRASWTSISMSPGGVVCVARSTMGAVGPGLGSVSPS